MRYIILLIDLDGTIKYLTRDKAYHRLASECEWRCSPARELAFKFGSLRAARGGFEMAAAMAPASTVIEIVVDFTRA